MSKLNAQGLKMIAEGLLLLAQSIESGDVEAAPAVQKVTKTTKTIETKEEKAAEVTESESYTAEQLEEMSYNDIKKLAKSLGISAVGNRTALVNAILGVSEDSEDEPEEEDEESEEITAETDEDDDSEDDSEDEDDEDADDEDDEDDISAQVESAVSEMSDDEIRELLADAELSTKGKRQALIARLVEAVEEGVIEFGDDEESDEETDEEPDEDESEDSADDEDDADVTKDMTKKRRAAYDQVCKDTESAFESGDITREDLIEFINDFNGTFEKFKKVSDEELLENYLTIAANLISDDGEVSEEPGLYYINDEPHCCGHPAAFNKKKNAYVCPVCGATYKA